MGVRRTDGNLMFMYALYLAATSVGNMMDRGMVTIFDMAVPASVLVYPVTLFVLFTVIELWRTDDAYRLVMLGVAAKFWGIIMLSLSSFLTSSVVVGLSTTATSSLLKMFGVSLHAVGGRWVIGTSLRAWTGSLVSFLIAQTLAVYTFDAVLRHHIRSKGSPWGGRWYRYLIASIVGESVELALFIFLCFAPEWGIIEGSLWGHIIVRIIITMLSIPFYYAITWRTRRGRSLM